MTYDLIECKLCNKSYSKLGMISHITRKHKIKYSDYKEKFVNEYHKCKNCTNQTLIQKSFCSKQCASLYGCKNRKNIRNGYSKITDKKIFKETYDNLSEEIKDNIISDYLENKIPIYKLMKKYNFDRYIINLIFLEKNIEKRKNTDIMQFNMQQQKIEKIKELSNSDIGKKIINEYQNFGVNIRSLAKKYDLNRGYINEILQLNNIKIKSCKQARNEIREINKKLGIHHPNYGKSPAVGTGHCHWYLYNGIRYQGSWEFRLGLWLEKNNLKFDCHKNVKIFEYEIDGNKKTYCPDFYIYNWNKYIEVKGYFSIEDRNKIDLIKNLYKDIDLEIYDKQKLKEIKAFEIDKELDIHLDDFIINDKNNRIKYNDFILMVDKNKLIDEEIFTGKSWLNLSKEYKIEYSIMSKTLNKLIPKSGTFEYYDFLIDRYLNINNLIENIKKYGKRKAVDLIDDRFSNYNKFRIIDRVESIMNNAVVASI